jgi:hypothetical protein
MTGRMLVLWVGIGGRGGGGEFGGRDNGVGCLWYSIGLGGGAGLWVSVFDVFWVFFGLLF